MDSHRRSLAKALTWRAGGMVITAIVAWIWTRRVEVAASIGLVDTLVKLVAFYLHERAWLRIRYGQAGRAEYEI